MEINRINLAKHKNKIRFLTFKQFIFIFSFLLSSLFLPSLILASDNIPTNGNNVVNIDAPSAPSNGMTQNEPHGGRLSFYFQNIDIRSLLQLLAKTSGVNFIIGDNVKGDITLNLKNVTWRQALDIILRSRGLAERHIGNAIYIDTADVLLTSEAKRLQSEQELANLGRPITAIVKFNYTNATSMAILVKGPQGSLLSPRGEVAVDARTNSLIIKDIRHNVDEVIRSLKTLDVPTRQVSIEARIVNIDTTYEEQLGVRFGISNTRSLSGTLAGANQLAQGTEVANVTPVDDRLNFDIPASVLSSGATPGSIGLALARLGPVLLDLELSALEEEGHIQIISKPRVVTSNQQRAVIETGQEIPYQEATSSGATSITFKKAVLSLEIIPQITPDNKINLRLRATQDTVGQPLVIAQAQANGSSTSTTVTTVPVAFGPPTINTQAVMSNVLLNNNETIVLGGVYKKSEQNTLDRVPFFSTLPLVGPLFRHRAVKHETSELLIFITPKIVESKHYALQGEG